MVYREARSAQASTPVEFRMRDGINDFDPLLLSLTGLLHPATDLLTSSHTVLMLETPDLLRVWRGRWLFGDLRLDIQRRELGCLYACKESIGWMVNAASTES